MTKFLYKLICIVLLTIIFPPNYSFASENFSTDLDAIYTIEDTGNSTVKFKITLTNKSETHFPASYKMNLNLDDIKSLKALDGSGEIDTSLEKTSDGYQLTLFLNEKPIGVNNNTTVEFSFKSDSIVSDSGTAIELNIPGVSNPDNFDNIKITVRAPKIYGAPNYIKPHSPDLVFTKEEILNSGISIAYGDTQSYAFSLNYHLRNPNFYPKNIEIAIPPDTNYQKVFIESINPKPINVKIDQDGNWLAIFRLSPLERKEVKVVGFTEISIEPNLSILSAGKKQLYTMPSRYWQSANEDIKKLATELKTPEAIYNYVVKTLNYDFDRVEKNKPRLGAKKTLSNPESAVCLEFTDLFIALTRAAGIPAREINGFASTGNSASQPLSLIADVLHAWPEYYDEEAGKWIMVDPTWGQTTGGVDYFEALDFDHFAFVIKGARDDYPIPAGGYKSKKEEGVKDVEVILSDNIPDSKYKTSITSRHSSEYIAGIPIVSKIRIVNTGRIAIPAQEFTVKSEDLSPHNQKTNLDSIPPYGSKEVEIRFDNQNFLTKNEAKFTIAYSDEIKEEKILISPIFISKKGGVYAGILAIIILIIAFGFRRLRFSGRK